MHTLVYATVRLRGFLVSSVVILYDREASVSKVLDELDIPPPQ
jgi:hypothetical protein